jgi:myo-inositol-1(or 4)-monophosphatase
VGISGFPGRHPGWAQYRALGAASLECCAVAEGVLDAYLVVGPSTLYGWDYLAGLLVCREVGAAEREREGRDLVVRDASSRRPIVAATTALADRLRGEEEL